jgi:hypothetical protein
MDAESVAKRVQDQGHGNVVYRGINGEYDPDKAGYYQMFTTSKQDAAEYGDNLLEVRLNLGDNAVVDGRGRNFNSIPTEDGRLVRTDDLAHEAREAGRDSLTIRNIHDKADNEIPRRPASSNSGPSDEEIMRELGLDYSPSTSASPAPDARNYDPVDVDVVYDPSRIRSVNAAYDPQYTGPNIMGSAALPVAAGLLSAGQSEDADAGLAAPMIKDSGFISAPRSEGLMDLTMAARGLERRLEGSPASLLFPEGLVNYLETVNRRTEDPNAMTRIMGLVDLIP